MMKSDNTKVSCIGSLLYCHGSNTLIMLDVEIAMAF
jgi:hypothetical protein